MIGFNKKIVVFTLIVFMAISASYFLFFSSPQEEGGTIRLVIPLKEEDSANYSINSLYGEGAIKNKTVFRLALAFYGLNKKIKPGAYIVESGSNAFTLASELKAPDEKWVVIPEGLRKEEIAEMFADTLGWSGEEIKKWTDEYATAKSDYFEGVYFPDTYLIPVDDSPEKIAERMINRFNEKFASYYDAFTKKNIHWLTAIKIASIVQREAAGKDDMPLIAGVLWNRLLSDIKLDIDATVQYARGDISSGWWAPIKPEDKNINSPYNTYLYKGLPPYPIANSGINAIEATLHPEKTKCFYYLHDNNKQIHCAVTYEKHLENINKYLK